MAGMIELTDKQAAEFFRRSYTAADGLWFVKVEEKYGFDAALDIDAAVWEILPKIQARMLKSVSGCHSGMQALLECLTTKLFLEGFVFEAEKRGDDNFDIVIRHCPWHELLLKSNRGQLSARIGDVICRSEYKIWAAEFGEDICFEIGERICQGSPHCILRFSR